MDGRWVENDVWQEKEYYNRAPRPCLVECDRLRRKRWAVARWAVKIMIIGGLVWIMLLAMFWAAKAMA